MAFNGSLLNLSGSNFPLKFVFKESYNITPNRRIDLDSQSDANGVLVRNVLSHTASTIELTTKPMWNKDFAEMMAFIRSKYVNTNEKKLNITYYSPDLDDYKTGNFYVPDFTVSINRVDVASKKIFYNSMTLKFIEY